MGAQRLISVDILCNHTDEAVLLAQPQQNPGILEEMHEFSKDLELSQMRLGFSPFVVGHPLVVGRKCCSRDFDGLLIMNSKSSSSPPCVLLGAMLRGTSKS